MIETLRIAIDIASGVVRIYESVEFWRPALALPDVMELPSWVAPSVALAALLSLLALSGVAVGSLAVLLTALLVAALIMDQVFGVAIELAR
jgi:hypothetical protein